MELEEQIKNLKEGIDRELGIFLDDKIAKARSSGLPEEFSEAVENVRDFMLRGGKRLRPILFCYGYTMSGGDQSRNIITAAPMAEFLHAYLLIHDDVIDQDNLRHGGPSMHFKYETDYKTKYPGQDLGHFGVSMAINVGDIVSSWSYEILANSDFDNDRKARAIGKIAQIVEETVIGQMLDELLEMGESFDENLVYSVQDYKTARYSVCGPLQLGAILAGASDEELRFIYDFSVPLGVAYQIQDDILGIFGDELKTGKPVGADIREGKKTLLITYAIRNSRQEDVDFILASLGNENLTESDVEKVREIIKKSGSLQYSEEKINQLTDEFLWKLKSDPGRFSDKYARLEDFSRYLIKRNN